jgi:membrane protein YdbS with pleckstrin-like domain
MHNISNEFRMNRKVFYLNCVSGALLSFIGIGVFLLIANYLLYKYTSVTVTENGILYRSGAITRKQRLIPYNKINSVDVQIGLIGRMWDYGNVLVSTGNDIEKIVIKSIERPRELQQMIETHIAAL